jgi:fatty acid-binding protein DegV
MEHRNAKRMFVAGAANIEEAEQLIERLRPSLPHTEFRMAPFGSVLGVYSGPVALGLGWTDRDH